jgi:hypothetical protein
MCLPAPNALSDLKAKIKSLLKRNKNKTEKPAEATTTEPATNGATATEAAPAEPAAGA